MSEVPKVSLDDFFAKKDKKKAKAKKFTTSDEIAKKLESTGSKKIGTDRQARKEKNTTTGSTVTVGSTDKQDDEWNEVDEKEVDYTNLKIQNLQISENRDEDKERSDEGEDGEFGSSKDVHSGPWNKMDKAQPPPPAPEPEKQPVAAAGGGTYVPPAMRGQTAASAVSRGRKAASAAPELSSDFDFPSLSSAAEVPTKPVKKTYDSAGDDFQNYKSREERAPYSGRSSGERSSYRSSDDRPSYRSSDDRPSYRSERSERSDRSDDRSGGSWRSTRNTEERPKFDDQRDWRSTDDKKRNIDDNWGRSDSSQSRFGARS